ncbi:hypothetical protein [Psychrobium sp. 1_MG-2023]|uniref:hypothetical protein n=1 Tax=Psychrobium sp. 1_MG-2023 TaxID=3062624 RepID=UPI000C31D8B9|nr:hypothetical protein [Psychrobium sp. 1_MG-2023]MDP2560713.1 hypothetical protein [Psychrobium sp. 1_MG-2023]PKF56607.1 hypothetical protein CW748_08980 [Alteromonadales bacterium alter-6D02]
MSVNNSIGANISFANQHSSYSTTDKQSKWSIPQPANNQTASNSAEKISISAEGQEKLQQEKSSDYGKALYDKRTEQQEKTEEVDPQASVVDKLIEELKQQIEEVEEKIKQLIGQDDEASLEQLKLLQDQLATMHSQLMELTALKLKLEGKGA